MTLRIATKTELDVYFAIFWLDDIVLCMEVDQAGSPLLLSLSLLAFFADGLIASSGSRAVQTDAKLQKLCTGRINIILHTTGCRNLDSAPPCRLLTWNLLKVYRERDTCFPTESDDAFPWWRMWLHEVNPVRHTVRWLRANQGTGITPTHYRPGDPFGNAETGKHSPVLDSVAQR